MLDLRSTNRHCYSALTKRYWRQGFALFAIAVFAFASPSPTCAQSLSDASALALRQLIDEDPQAYATTIGRITDRITTTQDLIDSNAPLVAAAWNRVLAGQSSDEQYNLLLTWTMPTDDRPSIRLLSCPVPTLAPPKSFARAIGKRPRDTTFAVAQTGGVPGWFCSGWRLLEAARDLGRLSRLISDLEPLAQSNVTGANIFLAMASAAKERGDLARSQQALASEVVDAHTVSLALATSSIASIADQSIDTLRRFAEQNTPLRSSVQWLHAMAVQRHMGESSMESIAKPQMKHWLSGNGSTGHQSGLPNPRPIWLTYEDHVLHLSGSGWDTLYCQFPLAGDFELLCETQTGGPDKLQGGLVYGGLQMEVDAANDKLQVSTLDGEILETRGCPFARNDTDPVFNQVSVRGFEDATHFEVNLHPMWAFDEASIVSSPWLALRSQGGTHQVFRNLRISGEPTIPREVTLLTGDRIVGWRHGLGAGDVDRAPKQWQLEDGVLTTGNAESEDQGMDQSMLVWDRPMFAGEDIRYEFRTNNELVPSVHPTYGRMAFLLLPDGIQVRWLSGNELDWTGLARDHTLLEPLSRRGPKPLQLKADGWNEVRMSRMKDALQIHLNDELVYERKLDFGGSSQFAFYRHSSSQSVQIRSVKASGNWPEKLPDDFQQSPIRLIREDR